MHFTSGIVTMLENQSKKIHHPVDLIQHPVKSFPWTVAPLANSVAVWPVTHQVYSYRDFEQNKFVPAVWWITGTSCYWEWVCWLMHSDGAKWNASVSAMGWTCDRPTSSMFPRSRNWEKGKDSGALGVAQDCVIFVKKSNKIGSFCLREVY